MLLLMRMDDSGPRLAGEDTKELSLFSSIKEGIQYVRVDGAMLAIFLLIVQMELLMRGPVTVGMPVLAHARLTEGALALGIVTSAYAGGSVLGTVLAGALPAPKRGLGPILVAVFTLSGILMAPFGLLDATWLAAAITLTIGVMGGYVGIMIISWIQGRTPPAMLGRVMSLLLVASVAVSPISIAASGPLIKLSLGWVFIVAGALMATSSMVIGLRREIRGMRMVENQDG
jgi:MFS family permease